MIVLYFCVSIYIQNSYYYIITTYLNKNGTEGLMYQGSCNMQSLSLRLPSNCPSKLTARYTPILFTIFLIPPNLKSIALMYRTKFYITYLPISPFSNIPNISYLSSSFHYPTRFCNKSVRYLYSFYCLDWHF